MPRSRKVRNPGATNNSSSTPPSSWYREYVPRFLWLLAPIGEQKKFRIGRRPKFLRPAFAAQVVADFQGVAGKLVDRQKRLTFVRAFGPRNIHCLGFLSRVEFQRAAIGALRGHGVLVVLDFKFDVL